MPIFLQRLCPSPVRWISGHEPGQFHPGNNDFHRESGVNHPLRRFRLWASEIAIASLRWGLPQDPERLAFLEHEQVMHWEEITENDDWIDDWKPPASVEKNIERVRAMELQIKEMQMRLQFLEEK